METLLKEWSNIREALVKVNESAPEPLLDVMYAFTPQHDEKFGDARYVYVCMYVCMCMFTAQYGEKFGMLDTCVYVCVCVYVCMYVYVCVYIYIYI